MAIGGGGRQVTRLLERHGWRGANLGGPGLIFGHAEHIWPLYYRRSLVTILAEYCRRRTRNSERIS